MIIKCYQDVTKADGLKEDNNLTKVSEDKEKTVDDSAMDCSDLDVDKQSKTELAITM